MMFDVCLICNVLLFGISSIYCIKSGIFIKAFYLRLYIPNLDKNIAINVYNFFKSIGNQKITMGGFNSKVNYKIAYDLKVNKPIVLFLAFDRRT